MVSLLLIWLVQTLVLKKLFIVVNVDWFFLSHRLPIALEAMKRGYDVTVMAIEEESKGEEIRSHGIKFIPLPATRGGSNIFSEMSLVNFLHKIYKKERPDIVHHVAIKPVIYGSLAARWAGIPVIVNAISGFGTVFIQRKNFSPGKALIKRIYKYALNHPAIRIIVQNKDDYQLVTSFKGIRKDQVTMIKGSGVDLTEYAFAPTQKHSPLVVLLAGRMLYDKGVEEFVNAARKIKADKKYVVEFLLAGKVDTENRSCIPVQKLLVWTKEGAVTWIGQQDDMLSLYRKADIVVLPSYREGLPKTLIEACAIGRPIVTTNVPGCREVVRNGENGLLVEKGNSEELAKAISILLSDEQMRARMGIKAREIAEREFSIRSVIDNTFAVYERA